MANETKKVLLLGNDFNTEVQAYANNLRQAKTTGEWTVDKVKETLSKADLRYPEKLFTKSDIEKMCYTVCGTVGEYDNYSDMLSNTLRKIGRSCVKLTDDIVTQQNICKSLTATVAWWYGFSYQITEGDSVLCTYSLEGSKDDTIELIDLGSGVSQDGRQFVSLAVVKNGERYFRHEFVYGNDWIDTFCENTYGEQDEPYLVYSEETQGFVLNK